MEFKDLFERFDTQGKLFLPKSSVEFKDIPWSEHSTFEGVALKHIVTSQQTGGTFSFHLVRILPNKKIGNHIHEKQLETHEVISGYGSCINNGVKIQYEPGTISVFQMNQSHEVVAGAEGLYLFAKFMPALV